MTSLYILVVMILFKFYFTGLSNKIIRNYKEKIVTGDWSQSIHCTVINERNGDDRNYAEHM